jgi:hypothetical protein
MRPVNPVLRDIFLLILLKLTFCFSAEEKYFGSGEKSPGYLLSGRRLKFFIVKYIFSMKEFVLYDKRDYYKFFYYPNPRRHNGRWKLS